MDSDLVMKVLGGLGLLLLGMKLMTDGLKLASGAMLRRVLGFWTKTPLRGLITGFMLTAIVQSSGAVTVVAIGIINAGLIKLRQAVWVVYGSNVGTTSTAWIVAYMGLKIHLKALALPIVALGTALWLSGGMKRRAALGEALAGFGIFFLGIEALQGSFQGLSENISLAGLSSGFLGILAFVGIGFLLTFLMQSSSAAMALVLTATASGFVPFQGAAAAVIGANVGSTTTSLLAVIGSTPNAKRLSAAHLFFNLITGIAALGLLPLALIFFERFHNSHSLDYVVSVAIFHTAFNILGVLLLLPLTRPLIRVLKRLFRTAEEDEGRTKYLDSTLVSTPALALSAMTMELGRIGEVARRMASTALMCRLKPCKEFIIDKGILERLQRKLGQFTVKLTKEGLSERSSELLPQIMRIAQYYNMAAEMAREAEQILVQQDPIQEKELLDRVEMLREKGHDCILLSDPERESFSRADMLTAQSAFEQYYQELKESLLTGGCGGEMSMDQMVGYLDNFSRLRRMVQQLVKAALLLKKVRDDSFISAGNKGEGE